MFDFSAIAPNLRMLISDFDGVFTDNKVYVDSVGNEMVSCSKSDSLGIDLYRRGRACGEISFDFIVVSTESNPVVSARCAKLKLESHSGIHDKRSFLTDLYKSKLNSSGVLEGYLYLGNDLNDLSALKICQYSAAPADAHPEIASAVDYVSKFAGGNGFIRDVLSKLLT